MFTGSSKKSEQSTRYKDHDFTYCLNFSSQSVATFWGPHRGTIKPLSPVRFTVAGSDVIEAVTPNAVEFRIWPNPTPQSINTAGQSYSQSLWQVNNELGIVLHRSHSLTKKLNGQPEGHTEFGHFELIMSQSRIATSATITGDGYSRASTAKAKIFSKDNNKENSKKNSY